MARALGFQGWGWVIMENLYGKPVAGTALQTGSVPLEPIENCFSKRHGFAAVKLFIYFSQVLRFGVREMWVFELET